MKKSIKKFFMLCLAFNIFSVTSIQAKETQCWIPEKNSNSYKKAAAHTVPGTIAFLIGAATAPAVGVIAVAVGAGIGAVIAGTTITSVVINRNLKEASAELVREAFVFNSADKESSVAGKQLNRAFKIAKRKLRRLRRKEGLPNYNLTIEQVASIIVKLDNAGNNCKKKGVIMHRFRIINNITVNANIQSSNISSASRRSKELPAQDDTNNDFENKFVTSK